METNILPKKNDKNLLHCVRYRHTSKYKRYMGNPVSIEKKVLLSRGIDEFNVGHTTRSAEIEQFIDNEFRYAEIQFGSHLQEYKNEYTEKMSELAAKQDEVAQLTADLAGLKKHIVNLESFFTEEES